MMQLYRPSLDCIVTRAGELLGEAHQLLQVWGAALQGPWDAHLHRDGGTP